MFELYVQTNLKQGERRDSFKSNLLWKDALDNHDVFHGHEASYLASNERQKRTQNNFKIPL